MTWHNLGDGHWWRPHADGARAWSALKMYRGWNLYLAANASPPFSFAVDRIVAGALEFDQNEAT